MKKLIQFFTKEDGLELTEYALVGALIAIATIAAITALSGGITAAFNRLAGAVTPAG
jgi:pilus assembly protein Flp/PilA